MNTLDRPGLQDTSDQLPYPFKNALMTSLVDELTNENAEESDEEFLISAANIAIAGLSSFLAEIPEHSWVDLQRQRRQFRRKFDAALFTMHVVEIQRSEWEAARTETSIFENIHDSLLSKHFSWAFGQSAEERELFSLFVERSVLIAGEIRSYTYALGAEHQRGEATYMRASAERILHEARTSKFMIHTLARNLTEGEGSHLDDTAVSERALNYLELAERYGTG